MGRSRLAEALDLCGDSQKGARGEATNAQISIFSVQSQCDLRVKTQLNNIISSVRRQWFNKLFSSFFL